MNTNQIRLTLRQSMKFHLIESIIDKENDGICQNKTRSELSKMLMIISRYSKREGMYQCLMCSKSTLSWFMWLWVVIQHRRTKKKQETYLTS